MKVFVCSQCQIEFDKTFKFCVECGHKLEEIPGALEVLALYEKLPEQLKLLEKHYKLEAALKENPESVAAFKQLIAEVRALISDFSNQTVNKDKITEIYRKCEKLIAESASLEEKRNKLKAKRAKIHSFVTYAVVSVVFIFILILLFGRGIAGCADEQVQQRKQCLKQASKLMLDVQEPYLALVGCRSTEKDLVIPEGITEIRASAFSNCNHDSVTIPNTVHTIESGAFSRIKKVISLNSTYKVDKAGALYKNFDCFLFLPKEYSGSYTVPGYLKIATKAFAGCTKLTELILPKTVESIAPGAFDGCINLKKVQIPKEKANKISSQIPSGCEVITY